MRRATKKSQQPSTAQQPDPEMIPTQDLFLDPINPRLTGSDFSVDDQDPILRTLWSEFDVAEIVGSIVASNGFWKHEPLVAARENGK